MKKEILKTLIKYLKYDETSISNRNIQLLYVKKNKELYVKFPEVDELKLFEDLCECQQERALFFSKLLGSTNDIKTID